jgi:hypothetical protein
VSHLHQSLAERSQPKIIPHNAAALAEARKRWPEATILPPRAPGETGPWAVISWCHRANGMISLHRSRAKAQECLRVLKRDGCCGEEFWWCRARGDVDGAADFHILVDLRKPEGAR